MKKFTLGLSILVSIAFNTTSKAQFEPFLGQVAFVPYNFVPKGWASCNGQLLTINQNQALYSLLGTTYGGNGTTNFALPDMRGRAIVHEGQMNGSSNFYQMGETGGAEFITLTTAQMPMHTHSISAVTGEGNQNSPNNNLPANTKVLDKEYSDAAADTTMKPTMVHPTGGNQPHENRSPFLTLKCIIATQGVYPSRD